MESAGIEPTSRIIGAPHRSCRLANIAFLVLAHFLDTPLAPYPPCACRIMCPWINEICKVGLEPTTSDQFMCIPLYQLSYLPTYTITIQAARLPTMNRCPTLGLNHKLHGFITFGQNIYSFTIAHTPDTLTSQNRLEVFLIVIQ